MSSPLSRGFAAQSTLGGRLVRAAVLGAALCVGLLSAPVQEEALGRESPRGSRGWHRQELERLGQRLLEAIRGRDVESLIRLLGDKVELGPDSGMKREALARELQSGKGRTYASLFDTARLAAIVEKKREAYFPPEIWRTLPPVKSVRDHLLAATGLRVRVEFMIRESEARPTLAIVGYEWAGRPASRETPNAGFMWLRGSWRLTHPFTIEGWGILAPWVDPRRPDP
ncbi:MAG: hypothetical protein HYY95_22025 [Candidatus Rokubacteria bacterium]|nr:hypothetical protein [Candidatus Rokubacteria bacterium]